jgi:hypothetical protein
MVVPLKWPKVSHLNIIAPARLNSLEIKNVGRDNATGFSSAQSHRGSFSEQVCP